MRRFMLLASLVLIVPAPSHAATVIASCGAFTPRIAPPPNIPVPPAIPPGSVPMWAPYDPVEACFTLFQQMTTATVTTLVNPDDDFFGIVGLRVAGVNGLFIQYEGTYVAGELVSGDETKTFTMLPGNWRLEVYLGGTTIPGSGGMRTGSFSVGTYRGSMSA